MISKIDEREYVLYIIKTCIKRDIIFEANRCAIVLKF